MFDLTDIIEHFKKEGKVIKEAPFAFAVSVLFIGIIAFLIAEYHESGVSEQKDATIKRAESDRDSFKEKMDEANSENAKLKAATPSGYVTQMVVTVSSITNVQIVTQLVASVGAIDGTRFMRENITNLVDGNKIVLRSKPIPQTLKMWNNASGVPLEGRMTLSNNIITIIDPSPVMYSVASSIKNGSGQIYVDYVSALSSNNINTNQ